MQRDSKLLPRGTVTYSVWVWSTVKSRQVTASVSANGRATFKPAFALCPSDHGTTCRVGSLPAFQALELLVTDYIGRKAHPGEQVGLTVVVQGVAQSSSSPPLSPAEAAVSTVLGQPTSSPTLPPGTGTGTGFPPTGSGLPGTTVSPGPISSLFPTISPTPNPQASKARSAKRKVTRTTSTASSLPLDSRLIGGQLAGLAVLVAAITMVVARLSLRTPQVAPAGPTSPQTPGAPELPESPAAPLSAETSPAPEPPARPE